MSNKGGRRGRIVERANRPGVDVVRSDGKITVTFEEGRMATQMVWSLAEARAFVGVMEGALAEDEEEAREVAVASGLVVTDRMPKNG